MDFFIGVWLIGFPVAFFVILSKWKKQKLKLTDLTENFQRLSVAMETVKDADEYFTSKRDAADKYYQQQVDSAKEQENKITEKLSLLTQKLESIKNEQKELASELIVLELDNLVGMVRIESYANMKSDEIKNKLAILNHSQDEMIKSGDALLITNTGSSKKIVDAQKKQILRCFNAECSNIIESFTVKNVDTSRSKIQRSFEAINKIFSIDGVQISQDFLSSKFEELSLVYAYMLKEEEEREQRKAIREQMVEEEKVRREIEREKQKIEKEEAQFTGEVKRLMGYLQKAKDEIERQLYVDKIKELESKLASLQEDKENVLQREQNTRAGFVYVISNIGSLGENVYKIGMTRRLEPMDRINELSSASVPFSFDVHAMIFSEDAPALENTLHQTFQKYQVNKINPRKEFFRVDLEEIKRVVKEQYNSTVKFIEEADAFEYRETLRLEQKEVVCV